jgi:hypothetical protein
MPRRYYYWIVVIIFVSCVPFFKRQSAFEKGVEYYQKSSYAEAVPYFLDHHQKYPADTTTLFYLQHCYRILGQSNEELVILEKLAQLGIGNTNVYLNLFHYYRNASRHDDMYAMLVTIKPTAARAIDERYVLTRGLLAELIAGASRRSVSDPIVYAASQGYIAVFPDGTFRDHDTISNGQLIVLLDRLVEPVYPKDFYALKHISDHSFLYLPYMRLVNLNILPFDADIEPHAHAATTVAAHAIGQLKQRGVID